MNSEVESLLFRGQYLTDDEIDSLKRSLGSMKVENLRNLSAKHYYYYYYLPILYNFRNEEKCTDKSQKKYNNNSIQ